ncbi:hypothetical protein [Synergistes jonesii]|uniref:hypothetical protein n=1 Tax=Synergistes jonesii TaxID=2754 RepID=UPI002431580D|nr:hypothetical protein [Synergistes jonesii]
MYLVSGTQQMRLFQAINESGETISIQRNAQGPILSRLIRTIASAEEPTLKAALRRRKLVALLLSVAPFPSSVQAKSYLEDIPLRILLSKRGIPGKRHLRSNNVQAGRNLLHPRLSDRDPFRDFQQAAGAFRCDAALRRVRCVKGAGYEVLLEKFDDHRGRPSQKIIC